MAVGTSPVEDKAGGRVPTVLGGELEPVASIGNPPTHIDDRNSGRQTPPEGKNEIGDQSENREGDPENFALHFRILAPLLFFPATNV